MPQIRFAMRLRSSTRRNKKPECRSDMSADALILSLVIPCYNEEDNLRPLIAAIREAVDPLQLPYEVVITDDCSKDKSWEILKELAAGDPRVRVQRFASNCGESA